MQFSPIIRPVTPNTTHHTVFDIGPNKTIQTICEIHLPKEPSPTSLIEHNSCISSRSGTPSIIAMIFNQTMHLSHLIKSGLKEEDVSCREELLKLPLFTQNHSNYENLSSSDLALALLNDYQEADFSSDDLQEFITLFNQCPSFSSLEETTILSFYETIFSFQSFNEIGKEHLDNLLKKTPNRGKIAFLSCALKHPAFQQEQFSRLCSLFRLFKALCTTDYSQSSKDSFLKAYFNHRTIQTLSNPQDLDLLLKIAPKSCEYQVLSHLLVHEAYGNLPSEDLVYFLDQFYFTIPKPPSESHLILRPLFQHPNIQNLSNRDIFDLIYTADPSKQNNCILYFLALSQNRPFEQTELEEIGQAFVQNTPQIKDLTLLFDLIYLRSRENALSEEQSKQFLLSLIWKQT